jgi:tetratricopeptide (TPR) repeat protein
VKYKRATELDPQNAQLWWKLALADERSEDWLGEADACAKAESAADKADGKKTHADYYFRHGYALEQRAEHGDVPWKDAEAPLRTAIQLDANFAKAYGELAWVLIHSGDEAGALQNWTRAIAARPDDTQYYVPLADEYRRLMYFTEEERVIKTGIAFAKPDDKHLFHLHALLGDSFEMRGNIEGAVAEYEAAKRACMTEGNCVGHPEASFYLGAAYAELTPPRKAEALKELTTFWKMTRGGAASQKWADVRAQAQEIARRLSGSLQ